MDALQLIRRRRTAVIVAAAVLLSALPLLLQLAGVRWFVVETPSMGRAAPVGTLVVTAPADRVRAGEVIAFVPPGTGVVYTHRAVRVTADAIRTRGDLDAAPDPWRLRVTDVVGRAVLVAPGLGFAAAGAPVLVGGLVLAWLCGLPVQERGPRRAVRLALASCAVSVAIAMHAPLIGATVLASAADAVGGMAVRVVGTGLLPVHVGDGGVGVTLAPGQAAVLHLPEASRWTLTTRLDLAWWGWALVGTVAALPSLAAWAYAFAVGRRIRLVRA